MLSEDKVTISVTRKKNLGNYESADVFICLTMSPGATQEEITAALDTGKLMYSNIIASVVEKVKELPNHV